MSGEAQPAFYAEAADTSALEQEIDRMVCELYGLTGDDLAANRTEVERRLKGGVGWVDFFEVF